MSDFSAFRNRLAKNLKHWSKWARRQSLSCYRVYDRDIPEFPLAIDIYQDHAHLQEFDTGWIMSDEEHARWVESVRQATAEVLGFPEQKVRFKLRTRQRGDSQYEKTGAKGAGFVVEENGHRFWVHLDAYLDTGLFLDHRNTRRMVQARAKGKRFLNLFAYTGSFTVYAAAGGATSSVTVDLSNTYQDWSRRNFELNGMDLEQHSLERADVFVWLDQAIEQGVKFDLIVMDPPSFSNSKKMQDVLDVQRDHPRLINACLKLLAPGGELFFSNNLRSFKLAADEIDSQQIQDISAQTVPEDFRNKKIHACWLITA
ncbi:MAG: class I SAM-dependent methyltransferase [Sulfuricellaceae bacterium]|nr:class I SAM-dependent methyltransferase [Sulfuricellaceae bacterium]